MRSTIDIRLPDPGLVENSAASEHCVHACYQMLLRTINGKSVPSFDDLDILMHKKAGLYTYDYSLIANLHRFGFKSDIIWSFDLAKMVENPQQFFEEVYGPEVGKITIENTDIPTLMTDVKELMDASEVQIVQRVPTFEDIRTKILEGFYIICTVNQRVLQADPGYVAHSVFIYGFNDLGVIIHNPGPPANRATEIPWDLFEKCWAYPDAKAKNILAFQAAD